MTDRISRRKGWFSQSIFSTLRTASITQRVALAVFLVFALAPVVFLGVMWLARGIAEDPQTLAWAIPSSRSLQLLGKSFLVAALVSVLATAFGTSLAFWMCGKGRWQRLVSITYFIPLLIPLYIHALTWMAIAGRRQILNQILDWCLGSEQITIPAYGFWPAVLVLSVATFPVVTLLVRSGLKAIEPDLLEAASLVRAPWSVGRYIAGPLVMPSVLAGAGLVFVLALVEYGTPAMFEYNVYVMEIYASFNQAFDPVRSFAISVPLMVLAVALLVLSQSQLRNSPLRGQPGFFLNLSTSTWPWPVQAFLFLSVGVWLIASAVPILVLLARVGAPATLTTAVAQAGPEIALTIAVAAVCGVIVTLVAVPIAVALTRQNGVWRLGWLLCALPLALPAPVTGISLIYLWNQPWLAWSYGTPLMLIVAHVARLLPFGIYAAASQVRHIDPLLVEAASLHDVSWRRRFLWVRAPMIAPAATITLVIVFVLSLGELGASLLVAPPGEATLPMRIYNLLHYGATDTVSALSLVILVIAGIVCAGLLETQRRLRWGKQ